MIGLIKVWYKSKKLKYGTYLMTYDQLTAKFIDDMDGMTLAEFVQYHYMAKEVLGMSALAHAAVPLVKPDYPPGESHRPGQYI